MSDGSPENAEESLEPSYFERLYAENPDPWNFQSSAYEREKYRATVDALGGARFASGFEIGCSIGVLTARIAGSCDALFSIDVSERALAEARRRLAGNPRVRFARMRFPDEAPPGPFDYVLLSEVAYYWSDADLERAKEAIVRAAPGGTLELVHLLANVREYVRDGDSVHGAFLADRRFTPLAALRAERYRIDVLRVA